MGGGGVLRTLLFVAILSASCARVTAQGHDHGNPGAHPDPMTCNAAPGEICYHAAIDTRHIPESPHPDASGMIHLVLNATRTELRYHVALDGLNLKPNAADRTEPDDIIGIHLHLHVPDTVGPHVLNIFGIATFNMPAEEDSDLVIDYMHRTLTGIYDDGDATIDPTTGEPYLPFFPLTSKPLSDWLDDLDNGDLMLAVHTNASGFPGMAIRGHISRVVPEPVSCVLIGMGLSFIFAARRRHNLKP
jgi:hypothetical protein